MKDDAEHVVDRFLAAWSRADVNELLDFFSDDAQWHPRPMKPVVGKTALRASLTECLAGVVGVCGEVQRQVSDGTTVMHERTDRYSLGGREMATPVGAAFDIRDGRIAAWREYFDMSPFIGP